MWEVMSYFKGSGDKKGWKEQTSTHFVKKIELRYGNDQVKTGENSVNMFRPGAEKLLVLYYFPLFCQTWKISLHTEFSKPWNRNCQHYLNVYSWIIETEHLCTVCMCVCVIFLPVSVYCHIAHSTVALFLVIATQVHSQGCSLQDDRNTHTHIRMSCVIVFKAHSC